MKDIYSLKLKENRKILLDGMKSGIPIGLGYFAVSFSLGIAAKNAGLSVLEATLASLLNNASAGQYAGFTVIAEDAGYIAMALMVFISNARYLLMSCAMSQRLKEGTAWYHRMLMSYNICDELFAIAIARPGCLNPNFSYGSVLVAAPCWAAGTALGCLAGNLLPARLVSAFSVALFGMFIAVIIPPARKNKIIAGAVAVCFLLSYLFTVLPVVREISSGISAIILTLAISSALAIFFPHTEEDEE